MIGHKSANEVAIHSVPRGFLTLNISTIRETLIFRSGWVMGIMPCVYFFPPLALLINHYKLDWKFQDFPLFPLIFSVFEKIVTKE